MLAICFRLNGFATGGGSVVTAAFATGLRATAGACLAFAGLGVGFSFSWSITVASDGIGAAPAIGIASVVSPGAAAGNVML